MITQKQNTDCIDLFWDNGKSIGYCYRDDDGYYVFVTGDQGTWADYVLRAIADTLTELNKQWDEKVKAIPPLPDDTPNNIEW